MRNLEEYNSVLEARSKRLDDLYERAEKVAEALNAKEVEFPLGAANEIGMLAKMSGLIFSTVATFDEAKGDTTLDQNYLDRLGATFDKIIDAEAELMTVATELMERDISEAERLAAGNTH